MGVGLLDLNRLQIVEFDAWAEQLEKVQKQRDKAAREAKQSGR